MKFLLTSIRNILPKEVPKYLGRWRIEYCETKINNTVDLANEDHCGTCNQYAANIRPKIWPNMPKVVDRKK